MIINGVRAENVLKYSILKLDDIPESGLIAVIGDNESGKSSIGESICFALFGRTFSLGPGELDKVIRWGESRCSIRLDFTTPNGQRYQVARFLDELGNHGASISRSGEEPMVRGVDEVAASLKEIIGFGYTEFIESFYLAQREITTPHPHSFAVKAMAGVDTLERVSTGCNDEIALAHRKRSEAAAQKADIEAQITALGLEEGVLASLEDRREEAQTAEEEDRRNIKTLKTLCERTDTNLSDLKKAADTWIAVSPAASLYEREIQAARLDGLLSAFEPEYAHDEPTAIPFKALGTLARDLKGHLDRFSHLYRAAGEYRTRIGHLLDHEDPAQAHADTHMSADNGSAETKGGDSGLPFTERRQALVSTQEATRSSRRTRRALSVLLMLLALFVWGAWHLLSFGEEAGQAVFGWLAAWYPAWDTELWPWLPYGAGILTALSLGVLIHSATLSSRLKKVQAEMDQLAEEEAEAQREYANLDSLEALPLPQACSQLSTVRETRLTERLSELVHGPASALLDTETNTSHRESFKKNVEDLERAIAAQRTAAEYEIERLHEAVTRHATGIARLDGMIEEEKKRVRRHRELSDIAQTLQSRVEELSHRVRVRELAMELLKGAIHYISQRFNTEIRNLAADSLPKFTSDRYEHLQIDESLKVKAFSNEKRNFMELDEISSGTQRQIMLAVRLALSQKLVNSVIQGPQMLFLDEPFAFFDEGRTASSLSVLPEVSKDFTQIWVTSQTFPEQARFDLSIECDARRSHSPQVHHTARGNLP